MTTNRLILIILAVTSVVALGYYIYNRGDNSKIPDGYAKVDSYRHTEPGQASCRALTPECGYCPGLVIEKQCYTDGSESNKQP